MSTTITAKEIADDVQQTFEGVTNDYRNLLEQRITKLSSLPADGHWINVEDQMPDENVSVLVYIPDEDDHITSGMWDVSKVWVLLDDYRKPKCEVTHWMPLPNPPKRK